MLVVINNPILLLSVARHLDLHELMSARSSAIQGSGEGMGVAACQFRKTAGLLPQTAIKLKHKSLFLGPWNQNRMTSDIQ